MENELEENQKNKKEEKKARKEFNKADFWTRIMAIALVIVMVAATFTTLIFAFI